MVPRLKKLLSAASVLTIVMSSVCIHASDSSRHRFEFGGPADSEFLLDGKPFQIIAGEIDPGRVPPEYWRHRIRMAKAMGLNTISTYIFWNQHEEQEGHFDFTTGGRDIGAFLKIAGEEGMWVLLRPGPYVCGEWDFGGLPWWLLRTPGIKLRSMDPRFTTPVERYIHELAKVIHPCMVENGGPVLMVQIENEYGSYPRRDRAFMAWLRDLWMKEGVNGPFFIADGAGEDYLKDTVMPGVAVGLDTGTKEEHFNLAHKMNPGVPAFSSEVYPGWLRHWGEHDWSPSNVSGLLKFYMDNRISFSLYVFHGGTNFGLTAGANMGAAFQPSITSYDYGAPLDEQGRPTSAYMAIRKQLSSYLTAREKLSEIPADVPSIEVPEFNMERWSGIWEQTPAPVTADVPMTFETLGQNQGIVLYRTQLSPGSKGRLQLEIHDYALVILNDKLIGVIDRREAQQGIDIAGISGKTATLDILVESMGHVNFDIGMESDSKGIIGQVKLGGDVLSHWQMFPYPLADDWASSLKKTTPVDGLPGGIFKGDFFLDAVGDTFFDMSAYKKGYVWVNGHNLGRYWSIGPQQRLYCPAPWLKQGENSVVVLDLDATKPQPLSGKMTRN